MSKPRYRERLAASSPTTCLRVVNQRDLSVVSEVATLVTARAHVCRVAALSSLLSPAQVERVNGVAAFGSRRQRHELEPLRFDLCFAALPAVQAMTTWQVRLFLLHFIIIIIIILKIDSVCLSFL